MIDPSSMVMFPNFMFLHHVDHPALFCVTVYSVELCSELDAKCLCLDSKSIHAYYQSMLFCNGVYGRETAAAQLECTISEANSLLDVNVAKNGKLKVIC